MKKTRRQLRLERIKKRKEKRLYLFSRITLFISLLVMLGAITYIVKYYMDIDQAKKTTNEVSTLIEDISSKPTTNVEKKPSFNLKDFHTKNPDSKFALNFPLLSLKNIVVQTTNNNYYLNYDFNKKFSLSGWLFADFRNKLNGSDKNIIIYGHNMRDGKTMFSPLTKMANKNYLSNLEDKDKIIEIYTQDKIEKYKIFSVYQEKDATVNLEFPQSDLQLQKYAKNMARKSIYNFNEDTNTIKKMITLATCGRTNSDRILIHAKLIEE